MIFSLFPPVRIFEVDFRGPQGGAKVAYIKAFGRFLDFGIENRVRFWGVPGCRFLIPFFGLGGVFRKNTAFRNAVNMCVLEHLGGRKDAFLLGYQSVDVASKHCLK